MNVKPVNQPPPTTPIQQKPQVAPPATPAVRDADHDGDHDQTVLRSPLPAGQGGVVDKDA